MDHDPAHLMLLTLAAAVAGGVLLMVVARRVGISSILLLLIGGVALGPEGIGFVQPAHLGATFETIVKLAVALVLFEGGLSLDLEGYRGSSGMIKRLLTLGVVVTWLATSLAVYVIFDLVLGDSLDPAFCLLCGSLVIVTGPTVIAPILKRIRAERRVHNILHWEAVLVDPVGVFLAVLCFEYFATDDGGVALVNFVTRFGAGSAIGVGGGWLIAKLMRTQIVPDDMVNPAAIACAMVVFGAAEWVLPEAGLLSVTAAGLVLGVMGRERLRGLREFKAEITELMIGLLFILLASRLELRQFVEFGATGAVLVAVVVLVVRPLAVWACAAGQGLRWQEKAFLSWVAPRGIVAASMASLVGLTLAHRGDTEGGEFAETFVYSVIATTVLLQGSTAGIVAKALGVRRPEPRGWLLVGAHALSRRVARFLMQRADLPVLIVDANARRVALAQDRGVPAIRVNALDTDTIEEHDEFLGIGRVLALTDNEELNLLVCQRWGEVLGRENAYRWGPRVAGTSRRGKAEVVWGNLPKPSLLDVELEHGDARTVATDTPPEPGEGTITCLLSLEGGEVRVEPGDDLADGVPRLCLYRAGQYVVHGVRNDLALRLEVADGEELSTRLVDAVAEAIPGTDRALLGQALHEREMVLASLLGHGVAVPHVRARSVESRLCAVALVPDGVDLGAPDNELVRLVFLVVSPEDDPEGHLATLAEIGRMVANDGTRANLLASTSPADLLRRLRAIDTGNLSPVA